MANRLLILDYYLTGKASTPAGDGSLQYTIQDNNDDVLQALTNTGITENPAGSKTYQVSVPTTWAGEIVWYDGATSLGGETFDPEPVPGFQGLSTLTVTFVDVNNATVPYVTFLVSGAGLAVTNISGTATVSIDDGTYTILAVPTAGVLWVSQAVIVSGATSVTIKGTVAKQTPPYISTPGSRRSIKLRRYQIKAASHAHLRGFRLRVEVAEAIGMPPEVFVYRRHPPDFNTGEVFDEFMTVASFPDLAEYPAYAPALDNRLPFFRLSFVELDVRSTKDYDDIWKLLLQQVCFLAGALDRADQLVFEEEVICNGADVPTSDTSMSSEESIYSESA